MVCRELDDLADQEMPTEAENQDAHRRLMVIRTELLAGAGSDPLTHVLIDLQKRREYPCRR